MSKYKDKMGRWLTNSLFLETSNNRDFCIYSLSDHQKEVDGKHYPSFRKLYMAIGDPTEFRVAEELFGGWAHWERIINNKMLLEVIEECRKELEIKLRSDGIKSIMEEAVDPSSKSKMQAARWLADEGWKPKSKVGRPTKAKGPTKTEVDARVEEIQDDYERILRSVN